MKFACKLYIITFFYFFILCIGIRAQEEVEQELFPVYEIEHLNEAAVDDNRIFPLIFNGYLYTFSMKQRLPIWRLFIGGDLIRPWAFKDGHLYFYDIYNRVYAVDIIKGIMKWRITIENEIRGRLIIYRGYIILATSKGLVYLLDAASGEIIETYTGSGEIYSGLELHDNLLIVPYKNGNIVAYNAETDKQLWAFNTGSIVTIHPVIDDDTLFFGGWNNTLYALDLRSGEVLWTSYVGKSVTRDFLVFKNEIILFFSDGEIMSLLRKDGTIKWVNFMKDVEFSYNYFAGAEKLYLFVPDFIALSPADGNLIFRYRERAFNLYKEMLFENMIEGKTPLSEEQKTDILREVYFSVSDYPILPPLYIYDSMVYFISEDSYLYVYDMEKDFFIIKYKMG